MNRQPKFQVKGWRPVTAGIASPRELGRAYTLARPHGKVMVEQMIQGDDYRLHVIKECCTHASKQVPAHVVGDGIHSIARLVARHAAARARNPDYRRYKSASLNDPPVVAVLKKQGLSADSVLAERAAQCIGLDHAGIDFITTDISRSWREIGGAICEINSTPGIALEAAPDKLLDAMFPERTNGRIPIILVVGTADETRAVRDHLRRYLEQRSIAAVHLYDRRACFRSHDITAGDGSAWTSTSLAATWRLSSANPTSPGTRVPRYQWLPGHNSDSTVFRSAKSGPSLTHG